MTAHSMPDDLAKDVRATAAAASDLGSEYHDELATSLVDKVEAELSRRREPATPYRPPTQARSAADGPAVAVAIIALVMAIPLTAIAAAVHAHSFATMVLIWCGIIGVNLAFAWGRRRD
jgi:hypothetical protein